MMESDTFTELTPGRVAVPPPWESVASASAGAGPGSVLRPIQFSTEDLPPEAQFDAWRAECSSVIEMVPPADSRDGFPAHYKMWKLGPLALSVVKTPAAAYLRTRAAIQRDGIDHWAIAVIRHGTHGMRTASHGLTTSLPGAPYIFSLGEAFEGQRSDVEWLCLFVPREVLPDFGPTMDRCLHRPLTNMMGQLLASYFDVLETRLPTMTEPELPRLVEATRAMISACVIPSPEARFAAAVQLDQARMERVRRAVRQNLRSPTLTPNRLCRTVGMSRSQLYRLFEPLGGVALHPVRAAAGGVSRAGESGGDAGHPHDRRESRLLRSLHLQPDVPAYLRVHADRPAHDGPGGPAQRAGDDAGHPGAGRFREPASDALTVAASAQVIRGRGARSPRC